MVVRFAGKLEHSVCQVEAPIQVQSGTNTLSRTTVLHALVMVQPIERLLHMDLLSADFRLFR